MALLLSNFTQVRLTEIAVLVRLLVRYMENPAFSEDSIVLPPPTEVSPTPKIETGNFQMQQPIVLNPGIASEVSEGSKRGSLATFGLLLAGWFVGNLIILSVLAVATVGTVGATGLIKVPLLSSYLFGQKLVSFTPVEIDYFAQADLKLSKIRTLEEGESLKKLELGEEEINALLNNQINNNIGFPIGNQKLKLVNSKFIFTGNLISTNAPVEIVGTMEVEGLTAQISIDQAKFGKIKVPSFLASSIVDNSLSKIGLSISGSTIPAQSLKILEGKIILSDVVNPEAP